MIRIQPASYTDNLTADGHEMTKQPYPYFVNSDGSVGRQDFWRGRVARVIGFQRDPAYNIVDLVWSEAASDPSRAVGMYPITSNADGEWRTGMTAVESVEIMEDTSS